MAGVVAASDFSRLGSYLDALSRLKPRKNGPDDADVLNSCDVVVPAERASVEFNAAEAVLTNRLLPILEGIAQAFAALPPEKACAQQSTTTRATAVGAAADIADRMASRTRHGDAKARPKAPHGLVSLRSLTHLQAAMELLVCWGIYPALDAGAALPIPQRPRPRTLRLSVAVLRWASRARRPEAAVQGAGTVCGTMMPLLRRSAHTLLALLRVEHFRSLLLPRYAPDALCAAMQLQERRAEGGDALLEDCLGLCPPRVAFGSLRAILAHASRRPLGSTGTTRAVGSSTGAADIGCAWMVDRAGRVLSRTVMQPGGVVAALDAMLGGLPAGSDHTKAQQHVARVVTSVPSGVQATVYAAAVVPQFVDVLRQASRWWAATLAKRDGPAGSQTSKALFAVDLHARMARLLLARLALMQSTSRRKLCADHSGGADGTLRQQSMIFLVLREALGPLVPRRACTSESTSSDYAPPRLRCTHSDRELATAIACVSLLVDGPGPPPPASLLQSLVDCGAFAGLLRLHAFLCRAPVATCDGLRAGASDIAVDTQNAGCGVGNHGENSVVRDVGQGEAEIGLGQGREKVAALLVAFVRSWDAEPAAAAFRHALLVPCAPPAAWLAADGTSASWRHVHFATSARGGVEVRRLDVVVDDHDGGHDVTDGQLVPAQGEIAEQMCADAEAEVRADASEIDADSEISAETVGTHLKTAGEIHDLRALQSGWFVRCAVRILRDEILRQAKDAADTERKEALAAMASGTSPGVAADAKASVAETTAARFGAAGEVICAPTVQAVAGELFVQMLGTFASLQLGEALVVEDEVETEDFALGNGKCGDMSPVDMADTDARDALQRLSTEESEPTAMQLLLRLSEALGGSTALLFADALQLMRALRGVLLRAVAVLQRAATTTATLAVGTVDNQSSDTMRATPDAGAQIEESGVATAMHTLLHQRVGLGLLSRGAQALSESASRSETASSSQAPAAASELLRLSLGVLCALVEGGSTRRPEPEERELRRLLPALRLLAQHPDVTIAETSSSLALAVLTRAHDRVQTGSANKQAKTQTPNATPGGLLPEVVAVVKEAEAEMRSSAVPLRAKGVVTLTRCIRTFAAERLRRNKPEEEWGSCGVGSDASAATHHDDKRDRGWGSELLCRYLERVLVSMLGDAESFVFLAAVQGLAALADAHPPCIERLAGLFASDIATAPLAPASVTVSANRSVLAVRVRIKLGEALMYSARRCGAVLPLRARYYVNAMIAVIKATNEKASQSVPAKEASGLTLAAQPAPRRALIVEMPPKPVLPRAGSDAAAVVPAASDAEVQSVSALPRAIDTPMRDPKPVLRPGDLRRRHEIAVLRASCLSNLAEVCETLGAAVAPFAQDVISCAEGVLTLERSGDTACVPVRRAAAFMLQRLLAGLQQGAGADLFGALSGGQLRTAYRLLRAVSDGALAPTDGSGVRVGAEDDVTKYHCNVALGMLDDTLLGGMAERCDQTSTTTATAAETAAAIGQLRVRVLQ